MKREINTFDNYFCDFFSLQDIPVPIEYRFYGNILKNNLLTQKRTNSI